MLMYGRPAQYCKAVMLQLKGNKFSFVFFFKERRFNRELILIPEVRDDENLDQSNSIKI